MTAEFKKWMAQSIAQFMDEFVAVSYTHLDVYKRQGLERPGMHQTAGCILSSMPAKATRMPSFY